MFGVFSAYEQQVIYDWIAGDWVDASNVKPALSIEAKQRLKSAPHASPGEAQSDFDSELRALEEDISTSQNEQESMSKLIALMSPSNHHSAPGLMATRIFSELLT
jgi:hypothetical protein